jgi:peptidoglycan/xylan/chitin deacetylase (PgdA/CDA1 family)
MSLLPVLLYHKLHPAFGYQDIVSLDAFKRQLIILQEMGYTPVSCQQVYESLEEVKTLPNKPVLITFDGGHISCYKYARPILEKFRFTAVFFVVGDWVLGGSVKENKDFQDCLNAAELRELAQSGFEIGIQGYRGTSFKELNLEEIRSEISKSLLLFQKLDIRVVNAVAYPFGEKPDGVWTKNKMYQMMKQQHIMLAFNKRNRTNDGSLMDRFDINRIEIDGNDTEKSFLSKLNRRRRWWF